MPLKKKKSTTNEPQNVKSHDKNLKQNSNFGGKNPYDYLIWFATLGRIEYTRIWI